MKLILKGYDLVKYDVNSKVVFEEIYDDIESYEVLSGNKAIEIGLKTDGTNVDDFNEYLLLFHTNGDISTFRNSYVDLFRY